MRADYWIQQFTTQTANNSVPNLTVIWLPDDHTNGTGSAYPSPNAYQADNDLALGRMVQAISSSNVWLSSAIFVEEDDSQDGVDHIDGHRQPVYVISPYAAQNTTGSGTGPVVHTRRAGVHNVERHLVESGDKWLKRRAGTFDACWSMHLAPEPAPGGATPTPVTG